MKIDVYPVGALDDILRLGRAVRSRRRDAVIWALWRSRGTAAYLRQKVQQRDWRAVKNTFNGYLAEPTPFPEGVRHCGSGWTKRRARRSLNHHLAAAGRSSLVVITPDQLDQAMVAYRRGARMTTWEECIEHDADRTLAGLRAALTEIGFDVERRTTETNPPGSGS